jgi:hypothetical protein
MMHDYTRIRGSAGLRQQLVAGIPDGVRVNPVCEGTKVCDHAARVYIFFYMVYDA